MTGEPPTHLNKSDVCFSNIVMHLWLWLVSPAAGFRKSSLTWSIKQSVGETKNVISKQRRPRMFQLLQTWTKN